MLRDDIQSLEPDSSSTQPTERAALLGPAMIRRMRNGSRWAGRAHRIRLCGFESTANLKANQMPKKTSEFTVDDIEYLHLGDRRMTLRLFRPPT